MFKFRVCVKNSTVISIFISTFTLLSFNTIINNYKALGSSNTQPPTIGIINQSIESGCGCGFKFASKSDSRKGFIFLSLAGEQAIVNIDGRDVQLREIKAAKSYSNGSISVTLNLNSVKKDYESNNYVGKITVNRAGKVTTRKIIGSCGC